MTSYSSAARPEPMTDTQLVGWMLALTAMTCLALAMGALVVEKLNSNAAVRIALDKVPVEKVVEFGHEDGAFAAALPLSSGETFPAASEPHVADRLPAPRPAVAIAPRPDRNGVIPIDFSLEQGETAVGGGVGVQKTIALSQGAMTGLKIFIVGDAVIEVDRLELARALAAIGAENKAVDLPAAGGNGRLSLDRVRHAGLDLRYDAVRDRLVLHP
ncbi:hypothetical protein K3162_09630 [Qipengyuania xiapuensis]|uniref:Uncharacterized protein n=1 Tax=Qipengyuania xiapuensis TaxID=2867236 RepID=A0ABX8ZVZ0_9SPHN|nr:hypothetical protein [Qipengyuania xiapuensis]QZD91813.1 hypothetical protein K3162_09630 [Qipengyuania xiapuensis]